MLLLLAGFAAAAAAQDGELSSFLDRVDVDVVNVEVFVTDRDGNLVTGLGRDDFELRVDGEPVPLTNFYVSETAARSVPELPTASADGAPQPLPEPAADAAGAEEPRRRPLYLMAYVDHVNLLPGDRKRALDELRVLVVERAAAGDPVMLVGYDGGLEVVQPFTRDTEALERGMDQLEKAATRRQVADTQLRTLVSRIRQDTVEGVPDAGVGDVALYRQERLQEARAAYEALGNAVRGLAGVSGRKAVLFVSGGIPRRPGAELAALVFGPETVGRSGGLDDLRNVYEQIAREANAHEITLYTFDARGPGANFFLNAESAGATDYASADSFAFERDSNFQEPLMEMAEDTGGRAILNTNNFADAMEGLLRDFRTFYSLGFASPGTGDGEYHRIEVTVKRPGLAVRHREGYLDKAPADQVADRAAAFLLNGWESNPMGVQLQFGAPKKHRRLWRVPVLVRIPARSVTLLPRGGERVGRVQIFVTVGDDQGRASEVSRLARDVAVPAAQAASDGAGDLGYAVELEMRPGPASLVVGVWDEIGGTESYVFQKVVVGGPN
jgi:VWFA-related protein